MKLKRVAICTPTREYVHGGFTYDLVQLIKKDPDNVFLISFGTIIGNNRTLLVDQARMQLVSHILFIDSDMRFPANTIERLVAHDKDIVAANCKQRTQDQWTARVNGEFISSVGKEGIEKVDTVGFGVMLIKLEVFLKIEKPYFANPYDGVKLIGEDVFFCEMAHRKDIDIFIDHDLSQDVKHIGSVELGF